MKNLFLILTVLAAGLFRAQLAAGKQTITVDGRSVDVVAPSNYDSNKTYPVIFFLHGLGGDRNSMQAPGVADAGQFIGVYPEGTASPALTALGINGRAWNSLTNIGPLTGNVNDVDFLVNVHHTVDEMAGTSSDLNRYFLIGFSNGGSMALKLVKNTGFFKAAVVGAMSEEQGANGVIPASAAKVPMLFMHGMNDQVVPFNGGQGSFGPLASFEPVRDAVKRWAQHNTGVSDTYQQLEYPGGAGVANYHFREYRDEANKKASVYLYMLPNTPHDLTAAAGFTLQNIMTTALRFFNAPLCYGFSKEFCTRNNIIR